MPESDNAKGNNQLELDGAEEEESRTDLFFHADAILSRREEISGVGEDCLAEERKLEGEGSTSMMVKQEKERW